MCRAQDFPPYDDPRCHDCGCPASHRVTLPMRGGPVSRFVCERGCVIYVNDGRWIIRRLTRADVRPAVSA